MDNIEVELEVKMEKKMENRRKIFSQVGLNLMASSCFASSSISGLRTLLVFVIPNRGSWSTPHE